MYIERVKKLYEPTSLFLESSNVFNTFEGSQKREVGSYSFFTLSMYTFKCGLALSRFY